MKININVFQYSQTFINGKHKFSKQVHLKGIMKVNHRCGSNKDRKRDEK